MPIVFKKQLDRLQTPNLRLSIESIMKMLDDYNCVGVASSSKKYHPESDNVIGGNVIHSLNVLYVILRLAQSMPHYDDPKELDILICSAILHDMCKYSDKNNYEHTQFDHPKIIHDKIEQYLWENKHLSQEIQAILTKVSENVYSHMSRWNTDERYPGITLPIPKNMSQMLLSISDMIAADKNIRIDISSVQ